MSRRPVPLMMAAVVISTHLGCVSPCYSAEATTDDGSKGLPLMILGIVAKPFLDNMVTKFYGWFGQKTGVPITAPMATDCSDACSQNIQANTSSTPNTNTPTTTSNLTQDAFGLAVGAWVKPPRLPAGEADLTQPQLWKKSSNGQSTEYTQVKLSLLLTDSGLVAVGVQDEGKPVQLRDTFVVGKPKDGHSQSVALFPIPSEQRIEVIRIKPTVAQEALQVYVLPCHVSNDTRGADVGEGSEAWQNLQTQLPATPAQLQVTDLKACPNASDVSWSEIYRQAQPLTVSKQDKRLYGTVDHVQAGQWYKLDIPYATGL